MHVYAITFVFSSYLCTTVGFQMNHTTMVNVYDYNTKICNIVSGNPLPVLCLFIQYCSILLLVYVVFFITNLSKNASYS